jgi:hypothetical protein
LRRDAGTGAPSNHQAGDRGAKAEVFHGLNATP